MTRINSGISPKILTDEHLLAEHREIKRLPAQYLLSVASGSINKIPDKFCLGKGHVLFFINKPLYTLNRYKEIREECLSRGFNVSDYSENWKAYPPDMYIDNYFPSIEENQLLVDRISRRILESSKKYFHYKSQQISKDQAIDLLYGSTKI